MIKISICSDLEQARILWQKYWPKNCLFDLWPLRSCFQSQFNHSPYFLVAAQNGIFRGMLALSRIDEEQSFGHFPGELWHGKTWLEQNRILASNSEVFNALLDHLPTGTTIRYLTDAPYLLNEFSVEVDETGYLFYPKLHDFSFQTYVQCFSGKSRKKFRREMERLQSGGLTYRYNCSADIEHMFRMNLENFKENSYFSDFRFFKAFEKIISWLYESGLLRITTVLIGGRVAAVDIGAVWNSTYTILAGGVHADFPGVAKLINFHHLEWACRQRLTVVDFLCGDFNWKERFNLTPRPLYKISNIQPRYGRQEILDDQQAACAM